jgi:hypothetical protein
MQLGAGAPFIVRWSMIDIFVESLLDALIVFGSVITIRAWGRSSCILRCRGPDDVRSRNL